MGGTTDENQNENHKNYDYLFKKEPEDIERFDTKNLLELNEPYEKEEPRLNDVEEDINVDMEKIESERIDSLINSTEITNIDIATMENGSSDGVVQHKLIKLDARKRKYYECGVCSKELRQDRLGEHMAKKHVTE